jgi:SAM-dependent methyltransferase
MGNMTDIDKLGTPQASTDTHRAPMDWGRGRYERTAAALAPAAETVVRAARLMPGECVLDVGCGAGSVALMAARAGARVSAVDPAARLLDVARALAKGEGLDVQFLAGEAAALPLPDASVSAALSNFGVIFSPDPAAAVAEMVRVLAPAGRIVFSAWLPGGAIGQLNATAMDLVRTALGAPAPPAPFAWHEQTALAGLFAAHDMTIAIEQHAIVFTDVSPAAYLEAERTSHPLAVAGFEVLERAGHADLASERLLQILQDGNEDPAAFRSTSSYVVVTATRR